MDTSIVAIICFAVLAYASSELKDKSLIVQGVDVTKLSDPELKLFCRALDEEFAGKLDLHVFKKTLTEGTKRRQKRFIFSFLFPMTRTYIATEDGGWRCHIEYNMDTMWDVNEAFIDLKPNNVQSSIEETGNNGTEKVLRGTIGNDVNVTAKSYGPSGLPTLEFIHDKVIRELRFQN